MKEYKLDLVVYIGRFQPLHNGHCKNIDRALLLAQKVLLIVGSDKVSRSIRNPWTTAERIELIRTVYKDSLHRIIIHPVEDNPFCNKSWFAKLREVIEFYKQRDSISKIGFIAGRQTEHNFYVSGIRDDIEMCNVEEYTGLTGSEIRKEILMYGRLDQVKQDIPQTTMGMLSKFLNTEVHKNLTEEWLCVYNYKTSWSKSPYPPTFLTTDAVIICNDLFYKELLLIRRKNHPGKNLLALPGGYTSINEPIEQSCLREVEEETGLQTSDLELVFACDVPNRSPRGREVSFVYFKQLVDLTRKNLKAGDDALSLVWIKIEDLHLHRDEFFLDHYHIIKKTIKLKEVK